jgi:disulfide bond formation protein DsbB
MKRSTTNQKSKSNRKAIISIILGALSFFSSLLDVVCGSLPCYIPGVGGLPIFFITGPLAIIGLICGILSLKSERKKLGIIGIIFSLIGLGASIFLYQLSLMV